VFEKDSDSKNKNKIADLLLLNEGDITIKEGGFGVLIAGAVENSGRIVVPAGKAVLAGGDAVRLNMSGDGLISVTIDKATASTIVDVAGNPVTEQVSNSWDIEADRGMVILKAESAAGIFEKAINLDGFTSAVKVQEQGGVVSLVSSGKIEVNGFVDADRLEVSGSSVAAPQKITIDQDFLNIAKLIVTPKELAERIIPNLNLKPAVVPAGAVVNETLGLKRIEEKSAITQDSYTNYKTTATAGGTQYDTENIFTQTVASSKIIDNAAAVNGKTVLSTTEFIKGAEVTMNMTQTKNVVDVQNNQERTMTEQKYLQEYASASVDNKVDRLNSANNSVIYTGSGSQEMLKTSALTIKDEHSKTMIDLAVGEDLVYTMNNRQSDLNLAKVTTHTNYKKDGVEVMTMAISRQALTQDLTNTQGTASAPDKVSTNVKSQSDIRNMTKTTAFYSKTADGNTQIVSDVKTARDITSGSVTNQRINNVSSVKTADSKAHTDVSVQATTLTNVALNSLVRPLKDMGKATAVATPAKKGAPLVLSQTTYKDQRMIEKTALSQQVSDRVDITTRSNASSLLKLKNGTSQTADVATDTTVLYKSVVDADAFYKEKGIQEVQYYNKPSNVTTAAQQVVKPQGAYVTAWDKLTDNSSTVTVDSRDHSLAQSHTDTVSTGDSKKKDYAYNYVYDVVSDGTYAYKSHSDSIATAQNTQYRSIGSDLINANLKTLDLFKSEKMGVLLKSKPSTSYNTEVDHITDYTYDSAYKRTYHADTRVDQSSWLGDDKKWNVTTKRNDNTKSTSDSSSRTKYDSSYTSKLNGKVNYTSVYSVWSQTVAAAKAATSVNATYLRKY